jgi:hypothetical protein
MKNKTIFRVVGGNSRRSTLNEYEIIPYLVVKETERYYTTSSNGKVELHQKRVTSNSEWFEDIEGSLRAVLSKLNNAIQSIRQSLAAVIAKTAPLRPHYQRLWVIRFALEKFEIQELKIVSSAYNLKTEKGWRVENNKTRIAKIKTDVTFIDKVVPSGRCYVYQHTSEPHNPKRPIERWVGLNLESLQGFAQQYALDRIKHLERCKQKMMDWVRQFEMARRYDD